MDSGKESNGEGEQAQHAKFITVCKTDEIPSGEGRAFEIDDKVIAVFNDNGTYRAMDDMCPHMGASLATGFFDGQVVSCPWHAWRFDTTDGSWCDNRRLKIPTFEVRLRGDEIQVKPEPRIIPDELDVRAGQAAGDDSEPPETEDRESGSESGQSEKSEEQGG